ncbi:SAM-dependent methyltransferase [Streptacidiphilus fuscans]|uniref:SAM-dependent methyltransferase n=1 Tax=Streptacidiphilus fuscans TaxID=2789292 RepID=UPI002E29279E|nr:SAM-dependent methyltransferase [Streptacidiphilus fuscans]
MESPKVEAWSLPSQQDSEHESRPKVDLRTDVAHSSRVYDYLLGGKTNFAADREAGDRILAEWPEARDSARGARTVMHRMVRRLAETHGIRQFLDIGTGIPTTPNVHEIVQSVDPSSRVVYVDNDPIVLAHARALLASTPEGRTAYVEGDLREPDAILAEVERRGTLDFTQPVALTLINLVHFYSDDAVQDLVPRLLSALAPGSFLALTAGTADAAPKRAEIASRRYTEAGIENHLRTRAQVERFFTGLELDEPGVALINHWHPELDDEPVLPDDETMAYAGLGRKA